MGEVYAAKMGLCALGDFCCGEIRTAEDEIQSIKKVVPEEEVYG
jgi:hypothetical protein